ncbi:restriction endonuclease subunit S [Phocaeicola vulgatus]|uniref:restriction endonuclease subunit S n=1 Tax=Phocaeicola vulgatus TaxID=821 RepID=UPI00216B507D|nr:restriction endonuclease subunit S [Phocaeicola vulgatus]
MRFPEFTDEWKESVLSDFVERVKRKNKNNLCKLPLTISAQYGLVDQISFFNKVIASENMSNYYLLHKGDFAYNKSYSSEYPWGAIKRLDCYEQGTLSSLYICFKPYSHVSSDFLTHYFETSKWHQGISEIAVEGARNHGLLNVGIQDFFETRHCLPQSLLEQEKIAKFLNLIEERIATQNKIIEKLQSLIKGLIDDIITLKCGQLVAFETLYSKAGEGGTPTTSNTEFYDNGSIPFIKIDDLSNKYLSANKDYITELGLKKSSAWLIPTHSIIYSNGATIGAISINKYPVCTKQGILGIVPNTNIDVEFLYYFMQSSYFQKEVERVVTEGTMKTAYLKDINHIKCPIPDLDRQKEISHLLSVLSLKEDVERQLLQKYQIQKQYLLRKMFI